MASVSKLVLRLSKACPEVLEGEGPFATLRDSAARCLSANGINKTINELNRLFNFVGITQLGLRKPEAVSKPLPLLLSPCNIPFAQKISPNQFLVNEFPSLAPSSSVL
ncbi:hypothetical protein Lnau_2522 [Legionella nautarum]|uniref:Uncharacterized protein n=1 Tax=Legionella nautarum TaxID=45070 RepID=A0A0W0WKM2_9GAMM|nr:hypothetical protein Lnau_2522 [Legionella nautarum]